MKKQTQYPAAKKSWQERTGDKVVGMRFGAEARARLERLAQRYGGKRQAIEAALLALERKETCSHPQTGDGDASHE